VETAARRDGDRRAASEAVGAARQRSERRRGRRGGQDDCGGPGDGAVGEAVGATAAHARRSGGGRRERGRLSRRAVPTAALSHGIGAARGSHVETARCRAGRGV
jgi:hypothetical protein